MIDNSDFKNLKINKAGNMTYHITVKNNEFTNTVKWSEHEDKSINDLYNKLLTTLKTSK